MNQLTNQSINQSNKQTAINQSLIKSTNQSINQINELINQPRRKPIKLQSTIALRATRYYRHSPIMDKIQIPIYSGLTEKDSQYYGLLLFRTQNNVPKVSAITRVDCNQAGLARKFIINQSINQSDNQLIHQIYNKLIN